MNTFCIIYDATTKKLSDLRDIHKYTNSYQAAFDKVVGLLTETSHYTQQSTKIYFQATIIKKFFYLDQVNLGRSDPQIT